MEQLLNGGETLQRNETQINHGEEHDMQWRYNSTFTNPKKEHTREYS